MVKWKITSLPLFNGGLEIGSLKNKILALLSKWLWRLSIERKALWRKVVSRIYGEGFQGWRILSLKVAPKRTAHGLTPLFRKFVKLKAGSGQEIFFQ